MTFNFATGFGSAIDGFNQQTQLGIDRANAAEDRAYSRTQRAYQANIQQHETDALQRQDVQRAADQSIPQVGSPIDGVTPAADGGSEANTDPSSIDAQNGNDVGSTIDKATPAPQVFTKDMVYRQQAQHAQAAGNTVQADQLNSQADQIAMQRAAAGFQQIAASSAGKSPYDIAMSAKDIYNNDPLPIGVSNIQPTANGGVSLVLTNKNSGQQFPKTFDNSRDLLTALQAHFSPDTYAAYQKLRIEADIKTQQSSDEARAKAQANPLKARSGEMVTPGVGDPRQPIVNTNFRPSVYANRPVDPNPDLTAAYRQLDFTATKLDTKLQPDQLPAAKALIQPIMESYRQRNGGQSLRPEVAVDVALRAASHPELIKPEIDFSTGTFVNSIPDSQGNMFVLPTKLQVDPKSGLPPGMKPEVAAAKVGDMIGALGPNAPAYVNAANDKSGAARAALLQQARQQVQQKLSTMPGYANASPQQQQAMVDPYFQKAQTIVQNQLDLISKFGPKTYGSQTAAPSLSLPSLVRPGGIMPAGGAATASGGEDGLEANKRWVRSKLMGPFDGPAKLLDISRTSTNPKFREAAKSLYDEQMSNQNAPAALPASAL